MFTFTTLFRPYTVCLDAHPVTLIMVILVLCSQEAQTFSYTLYPHEAT